jgi:RNA polymerase sigma-70 factor, ECF subfamily
MDVEDAKALEAYFAGDAEALAPLVEKTKRPLFSFLTRFAADPAEADEWFQETWVRAIQHMNRNPPEKLLSWLFRIAHNLIIDQSRRHKPACSLDAPLSHSGDSLTTQIPDGALPPDLAAGGRDLGRRIEAVAATLPLEQREVFWLRMQAQVPFKEIARIQDCSINTALARMQYALEKLRTTLAPEYQELKETTS